MVEHFLRVRSVRPHAARARHRVPRLHLESLEQRLCLSACRIVTWNTYNNPNNAASDLDFATVFQAIGEESAVGITKPLDLLVLTESDPVSDVRMESILDSIYATDQFTTVTSNVDGGGDTTGFIYDARTLQLLEQKELVQPLVHNTMRGKFRPVGTSGDSDFFVYAVHLKSGGASSDVNQRTLEMDFLRSDADALGEGASIIFAGDFNISGSAEGAWSSIVSPGSAQAFDAANSPGQWSDNAAFVDLHTHATTSMQSRYDFQFITSELQNGVGFEYIVNSHRAFGNNGSHGLFNPITAGNGAAPNVLSALVAASDHLPVVADYQIVAEPDILLRQSSGSTVVGEGAFYDTYSLELTTVPASDVVVTITASNQLDLGAGPGMPLTLTFHPADLLLEQTVVVRAQDDLIAEGTQFALVQHALESVDPIYDSLVLTSISVEIRDNDSPTILINEVDSDTPGTDTLEFIELYDGGVGNSPLGDYVVVLYNGSSDTSYAAFNLDGFTTNAQGYFVLGNPAVANVGLTFSNGLLQNGADAVALYRGAAASFPNGSAVTLNDLVDAVVYDTNDADDAGLLVLLSPGQPQVDESGGAGSTADSVARVPDYGAARNTNSYVAQPPTPGQANAPARPGVRIKQGGERTDVAEGGQGDLYTIVLTTIPQADVAITVTPDSNLDLGNGMGVSVPFVFTPANALLPRTVYVSAVDDSIYEGIHTGVLTHSIQSGDLGYATLSLPTIVANVADNESRFVVINEIDSDTAGVDELEFIELYDGGVGNTPLNGLVVVLFNGNGDAQYASYDLDGHATNAQGFFLIGSQQITNRDMTLTTAIQNGADAVALYEANASAVQQVVMDNLLDAIVYDTNDPDDPGLLALLLPGQPQVNESANGDPTLNSLARVPDGGTARSTSSYVAQIPTPGTYNARLGDFDQNGFYDLIDIDALVGAISSGSGLPMFDLNHDALVNNSDLDIWLQLAGAANLGAGRAYLRGDANLDGVVDGSDFIVWNSHKFTSTAAWSAGDFNADGVVDGSDFILWNGNKFTSADLRGKWRVPSRSRLPDGTFRPDLPCGRTVRASEVGPICRTGPSVRGLPCGRLK